LRVVPEEQAVKEIRKTAKRITMAAKSSLSS
jgi:hypothetical protein